MLYKLIKKHLQIPTGRPLKSIKQKFFHKGRNKRNRRSGKPAEKALLYHFISRNGMRSVLCCSFQHKIQPFKRESAGNPHARVRSLSRIKKEASFKALAFCSKSEPSKAEAGPEALKAATWLLSGSSTGTPTHFTRHTHVPRYPR